MAVAIKRVNAQYDFTQNRLTNIAAPVAGTDATTKTYVDTIKDYFDALQLGMVWRPAVRAAGTGNVDLATPGTLDGVADLADDDRVLLMNQTDKTENGLYRVDGGALVRDTDVLKSGSAVTVNEGTTYGNKSYTLITDGDINPGTTEIEWALVNNNTAPVYQSGNGILVDPDDHSINVRVGNNAGINVGGNGLVLALSSQGALSIGGAGLAANPGYGMRINVDDNTLDVALADESGLDHSGSGLLRVKLEDGGGIQIGDDGGLELATALADQVDANGGIVAGVSGLAVKPGSGISVGAAGVTINADTNAFWFDDDNGGRFSLNYGPGLTPASGDVRVKNDGPSIAVGGNGIKVKVDPAAGLTTTVTGLGVLLAASNSGLEFDGSGGLKLALNIADNVEANGGLVIGAGGGLAVNAGDGLWIDGAGKLNAGVDDTKGTTIDGGAIAIKLGTDPGLEITSQGLKAKAGPGTFIDEFGIQVSAGNGINVAGGSVHAKPAGDGGLAVDGGGLRINADTSAFWFDEDNGGRFSLNYGPGLTPASGDVRVKADGNSLTVGGNGVKVKVDPAGLLVVAGAGLGVDTAKVARRFSMVIGDGAADTIQIPHNLGNRAVTVEVITNSGAYETVECAVSRPDVNTVEITFGTAPAQDEYLVAVVG